MSIVNFRLFKQRKKEEKDKPKDLVFSKKWELVGIKIDNLLEKDIINLKKEYNLSTLHSSQAKLKCLIRLSNELDITITSIEFTPNLDDEDYCEIRTYLKNKENIKLINLIKQLEEETNISEITFVLGKTYEKFAGISISITNNGKFTTNYDVEIEFLDLLSSEFLGVLTGKYRCKE